ncbi:MAG: UDP-N-acetylmuramate--L-alanine ligase [Planctomycetes bacterium]|nr:UDP-N-acetylmuramate--L-alanine ligase [Planctomycetota bacterium]
MNRNIYKLAPHSVIHFIGIGGTGMSGLAKFSHAFGYAVQGSDAKHSSTLDELNALGIKTFAGHSAEHIIPETGLIVISAAIKDENPELAYAKKLKIPIIKYAALLGELTQHYETVAVAGCHGKTTTTSMIAHILRHSGRNPSYVIGGNAPDLEGNSNAGTGRNMVVEACEYDRSFLNLHPRMEVITNIEEDHLDYYKDINDISDAYIDFIRLLRHDDYLLVCADNPNAVRAARHTKSYVETYGVLNQNAVWSARNIRLRDGIRHFELFKEENFFDNFSLRLPGYHNITNAIASIVIAHKLGVHSPEIKSALDAFRGVERRMEIIGKIGDNIVMDDYGHHPTEIKTVYEALREFYPGYGICLIFQPHQHSRLRMLMNDFVQVLKEFDYVLVPDIFYARDSAEEVKKTHATDLVKLLQEKGTQAKYISNFDEIVKFAGVFAQSLPCLEFGAAEKIVIITMGAGDVFMVSHGLVRRNTR